MPVDLDHVRAAPADDGELQLIVVRPSREERRLVEQAEVRLDVGVVGDDWLDRGSKDTDDGSAEPGRQVTLMSVRALAAVTDDRSMWPLAGDQLLVDLDLTEANLPAGTRLSIGDVLLEVSALPHTGCAKFAARFGAAATRLINTGEGKVLRMRGINATVVRAGTVRVGDRIRKVSALAPA